MKSLLEIYFLQTYIKIKETTTHCNKHPSSTILSIPQNNNIIEKAVIYNNTPFKNNLIISVFSN